MSEIEFRSDMSVELVDSMGNDLSVVRSARVSTGKDLPDSKGIVDRTSQSYTDIKTAAEYDALTAAPGLIKFLMKNRHGTPFEHNAFTFRVEAPIFVWREFHRHRVGFSYNEESSRYMQLAPVFYAPSHSRPLTQVGKPGHYTFEPGTAAQQEAVTEMIEDCATNDYNAYCTLLGDGIAREVARMVLPVNIYSACYVTCNARSIMSFLSLRTKHEDSAYPSFPQREIEMVAELIEEAWTSIMPLTAAAFTEFGRVSP